MTTPHHIALWLDSGARVFAPDGEVLAVHANEEVELVSGARLEPSGLAATTKDYKHIYPEESNGHQEPVQVASCI